MGKSIDWIGSTRTDVRGFPEDARQAIGHQLWLLEQGEAPIDFKPVSDIGPGACEIRIRIGDAYRVIYVARWDRYVYVLHAFQKTTAKMPKRDADLAKKRYKEAEQKARVRAEESKK